MTSRCLSADSLRFWDHPVPAGSLRRPCGWPTGQPDTSPAPRPDPIGVPTFRMGETRVGWVPSLRRSLGVPADGHVAVGLSRVRRRGLRAWLAHAVLRTHQSGYCAIDDASTRVLSRSPVHAFPGPAWGDGSPAPWALPLASHPTVTSDARRDWEQAWTLAWRQPFLCHTPAMRLRVARRRTLG
jgi:hypothetical protein